MLLNQIWVHLPAHGTANLLTPVAVKTSAAFTAGAKQGVWAANAQKA